MSDEQQSDNQTNLPSHIAYAVEDGRDDKSHWHKIGAAWPAKGDGLSLRLSAVPIDGHVVLRSREELERLRSERATRQQAEGPHPAPGAHAQSQQTHPGSQRGAPETPQATHPKVQH